MTINRRKFISSASAAGAASAVLGSSSLGLAEASTPNLFSSCELKAPKDKVTPTFVATWPFGLAACEKAIETAKNGSMLDAIEEGIKIVEADTTNASVGIGGIPNADGKVELDACIMSGPGHLAGSVGGIQDILHPISVARRVMEDTIHVMLVGEGAKKFAIEQGFTETELLSESQRQQWEQWKADKRAKSASLEVTEFQHDTIAMLGVDENGNMFGGCSTSGWGYKIPGRVGDSPILGSGLYVDNTVGGAGATGVGENVMRYCASFLIVEFMRSGLSPTLACQAAIERIESLDPRGIGELDINFVALNKAGVFGAAGTSKGFRYSYATDKSSAVLDGFAMSEKQIGPEGGNIR